MRIFLDTRRKYMRKRTNPEGAPASIEDCTVTLAHESYSYTGQPIMPVVSVVTAEGVPLTVNTDYLVSYHDNTNVGAGTAVVTGTGQYIGSVTKTFQITSAAPEPTGSWTFDLAETEHVATLETDADEWNMNNIRSISFSGSESTRNILFSRYSNSHNQIYTWDFNGSSVSGRSFISDVFGESIQKQPIVGRFLSNGSKILFTSKESGERAYPWIIECETPYDVTTGTIPAQQGTQTGQYFFTLNSYCVLDSSSKIVSIIKRKDSGVWYIRLAILNYDKNNNSSSIFQYVDSVDGVSIGNSKIAVSQDGKRIVFAYGNTSNNHLMLKSFTFGTACDLTTLVSDGDAFDTGISIALSYEWDFAINDSGTKMVCFHLHSGSNNSNYLEIFNLKEPEQE